MPKTTVTERPTEQIDPATGKNIVYRDIARWQTITERGGPNPEDCRGSFFAMEKLHSELSDQIAILTGRRRHIEIAMRMFQVGMNDQQ